MAGDVLCPQCCHSIDTDDWFESWHFNDDKFDAVCPECKADFQVRVVMDVSYEVLDE
jgi:hypothetical protein